MMKAAIKNVLARLEKFANNLKNQIIFISTIKFREEMN